MKAMLEFDLPDDDYQFAVATRASDMHEALIALVEHVRSREKYADLSPDAEQELSTIRAVMRDARVDELVDLP